MIKNIFSKIKKSFHFDEELYDEDDEFETTNNSKKGIKENIIENAVLSQIEVNDSSKTVWPQSDDIYGELSVDIYETENDILIQTMIAGTKPEELEISLSRDMVNIKGKREDKRKVDDKNFYIKELYWGSFARTVSLPSEVDIDMVDAVEKHGLLTIRLPKIDKTKKASIKVKSI